MTWRLVVASVDDPARRHVIDVRQGDLARLERMYDTAIERMELGSYYRLLPLAWLALTERMGVADVGDLEAFLNEFEVVLDADELAEAGESGKPSGQIRNTG